MLKGESMSPFESGPPPIPEAAKKKTEKKDLEADAAQKLEGMDTDEQMTRKTPGEYFTFDAERKFEAQKAEWKKIETDLKDQYEGIVARLMGGPRESLDPISQKVFDAHLTAKDETVKSVLSELRAKQTPEGAMEKATKEIETRLFG